MRRVSGKVDQYVDAIGAYRLRERLVRQAGNLLARIGQNRGEIGVGSRIVGIAVDRPPVERGPFFQRADSVQHHGEIGVKARDVGVDLDGLTQQPGRGTLIACLVTRQGGGIQRPCLIPGRTYPSRRRRG